MTSLSVAVAVEKQRRFFVDNLMLGVQLVHRALSCPQRIFVVSLQEIDFCPLIGCCFVIDRLAHSTLQLLCGNARTTAV